MRGDGEWWSLGGVEPLTSDFLGSRGRASFAKSAPLAIIDVAVGHTLSQQRADHFTLWRIELRHIFDE
jgi:hypothetical protein